MKLALQMIKMTIDIYFWRYVPCLLMALSLSLVVVVYIYMVCFYIFALSGNHFFMSFCFSLLSLRGEERNFFDLAEILQCDTFLDI